MREETKLFAAKKKCTIKADASDANINNGDAFFCIRSFSKKMNPIKSFFNKLEIRIKYVNAIYFEMQLTVRLVLKSTEQYSLLVEQTVTKKLRKVHTISAIHWGLNEERVSCGVSWSFYCFRISIQRIEISLIFFPFLVWSGLNVYLWICTYVLLMWIH